MSETAATQLRRLLLLIPRVADGEPHRVDALLAEAGVDRRTLVRDLEALTDRFGEPGGFVAGLEVRLDGTHVELRTDHFRRPMRLTLGELCALELGLAMLAGERPPEERTAIERARDRLRQAIAHAPAADRWLADGAPAPLHAEAAPADARERALLAELRAARRLRRKVRVRYRKPDDTAASERTVCPYALVAARGAWYLIAWCEAGAGVRVFRLDRMDGVAATVERYEVPASFEPAAVLQDGRMFVGGERPLGEVVVRYSPRVARWVAEREGRAPDADGSLTVAYPLGDAGWAVRHVLQYGAEAEVVAPAGVRALVAARLDAMLGAAGD